ncbi:DUF4266 domain-containing protein [Chitinimonas sp.]|uniref:DUF4266 domain-containing protein n=1 Tax=Chitinimonas sp. TaxID=1934313 RepID=UPI0035B415AE
MRSSLLIVIALLAGCASVQPWEKGYLAKRQMAFDPDPVEARQKNHLYASKEAAKGGTGVGGGGCGCN